MASRLVTYAEWLKHGIYPADSPGKDAGKPFNPSDPNLRNYYNNYVTKWNAAPEALRIAINVQHGLGAFNSGNGEGEEGNEGGKDRHLPSTVPSEVISPVYERPGLLDWSRFMPTDSRNILGGGYMDPSLLASQRSITAGDGQYYQPWAKLGGSGSSASGLWDYQPPTTSLFSPFGKALNIPPASSFMLPEGGDETDDDETDDDGNPGKS